MPSINHNALKMCEQIAIDVLSLKVNEEITMDFKDETIVLKRTK